MNIAIQKTLRLMQYTTAHEFFTPINSLKTMTDLLLPFIKQEGLPFVKALQASCISLQHITQNMIDLSTAVCGQLSANFTWFSLTAELDHMFKHFMYLSQEKGIEFRIEVGSSIPG